MGKVKREKKCKNLLKWSFETDAPRFSLIFLLLFFCACDYIMNITLCELSFNHHHTCIVCSRFKINIFFASFLVFEVLFSVVRYVCVCVFYFCFIYTYSNENAMLFFFFFFHWIRKCVYHSIPRLIYELIGIIAFIVFVRFFFCSSLHIASDFFFLLYFVLVFIRSAFEEENRGTGSVVVIFLLCVYLAFIVGKI